MEVAEGKSSLKTNSRIESECIKNHPLQVDVKIEKESDNEEETEINVLYADHIIVIKEEMVIGPEVLQHPIYNSSCSKDVTPLKTPKLEKIYEITNPEDPQTTKEIGAEEDITASDTDALPHEKPRLQKQQETTDLQENSDNDTQQGCTPNVDLKFDPSTNIQSKQKDNTSKFTKKSKPSNKSETHKKTQVKDKNINRYTSYNVFTCNDCGEHFRRKRQLMQHIESHEKIKHKIYFNCKECTYQTVIRDSLERHERVHDKSRRYVCDVCGYRFKYKRGLEIHLQSVHLVNRIHECGVCDYRTNNISNLNRHLQIHSGEKPCSCSMCEYRCTKKGSLTKHMKIHTGEKPFPCTMCEYRCAKKSHLKAHMQIHTGEKPFSCTVCEYRSTHKSHLTTHVKMHTGEKPYSCTLCEHRCSRKSNLTIHMKIHTGKKPFSCTVCDCICNEKASLTRHMKIHTGEKPFSCTVCEYRCAQKSNLTIHMKIHTGEKPFSCTVCKYRCALKSNLRAHIKRIHNK